MRTLIFPILALALIGCTRSEDGLGGCTLIGCSDTVTLSLGNPHERYSDEMPLTFRSCLAEVCRSWTLDDGEGPRSCIQIAEEKYHPLARCDVDYQQQVRIVLPLDTRAEAELPVALTIYSKGGATLFEGQEMAKVKPTYPNGYECDKDYPCYGGSVDFGPLISLP